MDNRKKTCHVLRLDLKDSREGVCQKGRWRSLHVEWPKTEKALQPTVESVIRGFRCLYEIHANAERERERRTDRQRDRDVEKDQEEKKAFARSEKLFVWA